MLDHVIAALALKDQVRQGWRLRGIREPESVGDHSWGTAYLCLLYAEEAGVDLAAALAMAVVHDLAEAVTGDVPTRVATLHDKDRREEKAHRERDAMDQLFTAAETEPLATAGPADTRPAAGRVRSLWDEYEAATTDVARFVRDMNLIDMCAQAFRYERDGRYPHYGTGGAPAEPGIKGAGAKEPPYPRLDEFFATSEPRLSTGLGRRLFADLYARYRAL